MASTFAWVDFEEKDRNKMMEVIRFFQETDTRDELGIGSIRDTFSDLFFPGTMTVQTRAKYMLFIPWIYRRHENLRTPSRDIAEKARTDEVKLIHALLSSSDPEGTIGGNSKESLQRLPSNVYWTGLKKWGIRKYNGSLDEYHQSLSSYYTIKREFLRGDDKEPILGSPPENWDPGLPKPPVDFFLKDGFQAEFALSREESEYLVERLITSCNESLLTYLVCNTKQTSCPFIWHHPEYNGFPEVLKEKIIHARNFSFIIRGSALLYNLMLAERAQRSDQEKLITDYQDRIRSWSADLNDYGIISIPWNLTVFWQIVDNGPYHVTRLTREFVEQWIARVMNDPEPNRLMADKHMRSLIKSRELHLKKGRSRLHYQRPLELWSGDAGTNQLNYRWKVVNIIVNDILAGLGR